MVPLNRKHIIGLFVFVTLVATVMAVAAQDIQYPTYEYYGEVLSADEFLKLIETHPETPVGCTPLPSVALYIGDPAASIDFICFNTEEELQAHIDKVLTPQWEQIAQEYPAPQPEDTTLRSNHWALYAQSYYVSHLADVHDGTNCYGTSGVWSAYKDGSPNTLYLYRYTNCTGTPYFAFTDSVYSCGLAWPLYCGGSQGVKVP